MSTLLVLGGARSGKSLYAESLAKGQKFYVATAEASDEEMSGQAKIDQKPHGVIREQIQAVCGLEDTEALPGKELQRHRGN